MLNRLPALHDVDAELARRKRNGAATEQLKQAFRKNHEYLLAHPEALADTGIAKLSSPRLSDVEEGIERLIGRYGRDKAIAFALLAGRACGPTHPCHETRLRALCREERRFPRRKPRA
jgi:hypothetical protein